MASVSLDPACTLTGTFSLPFRHCAITQCAPVGIIEITDDNGNPRLACIRMRRRGGGKREYARRSRARQNLTYRKFHVFLPRQRWPQIVIINRLTTCLDEWLND
jgi:hypothetical protein